MAVKALITAAGLGKRFGALTKRTNKCLLHVDGKPLIRHIVESLRAEKIRDIVIVTGYQHTQVEREVKRFARCFYNPFYRVSGILSSFWEARYELAGTPFVFTTSDHWFHPSVLGRLLRKPDDIRIIVQKKKNYTKEDAKVIIRGTRVVRLGKDVSPEEADGEFGGMTYFSPRVSKFFFSELANGFEKDGLHGYMMQILLAVSHKHGIPITYTICSDGSRIEVDSVHDLIAARKIAHQFKQRRRK